MYTLITAFFTLKTGEIIRKTIIIFTEIVELIQKEAGQRKGHDKRDPSSKLLVIYLHTSHALL